MQVLAKIQSKSQPCSLLVRKSFWKIFLKFYDVYYRECVSVEDTKGLHVLPHWLYVDVGFI